MEVGGKTGSGGVYVSDNVEKRFETNIYIYSYVGFCQQFMWLVENGLWKPTCQNSDVTWIVRDFA
jgi:hypothetical protein